MCVLGMAVAEKFLKTTPEKKKITGGFEKGVTTQKTLAEKFGCTPRTPRRHIKQSAETPRGANGP